MSKLPDQVLDTDDPGDDIIARFEYQHCYAAINAVRMLAPNSQIAEITCENHEDFVIRSSDGTFIAVQVKTRDLSQKPFKATEPQVIHSIGRFAALEQKFPGAFARFEFSTNFAFWQEAETENNLPFLVEEIQKQQGLEDLNPSHPARAWIAKIQEASGASQADVIKVISRFTHSSRNNTVATINSDLLKAVSELPGFNQHQYIVLQDIADRLINLTRKAAIKSDGTSVLELYEPGSNLPQVLSAQRLAAKRVKKAQVEEIVAKASKAGEAEAAANNESPGDVQAMLRRASRDLLDWPRSLPDGKQLQRPELSHLLLVIEENEASTKVLLGPPGSGKSALLASLAQKLTLDVISFIAIKADLLPTSVQTENDLAQFLLLPEQPSTLLIGLAKTKPVVLLIDQLDALADHVDLSTGRLSVLLNLVRKLGGTKNVHIVLSARTFEYNHDTRLSAINAESVTLSLPPWSEVNLVLEEHGIKATGWPPDAQEVLRHPQALKTFLGLSGEAHGVAFDKYQKMLDQLWDERILSRSDGSRVARLAQNIAESMAAQETLWLGAVRFEDHHADLTVLIKSGILTDYRGTGRVGFSHQSVFEHTLARAFSKGEGRLSSYVLERQSSLFVRPKLWAALNYLREVDVITYHAELRSIWAEPGLRFHLQHMLIEFLGQQKSPTETERLLFEEALNSDNRRVAFQAMIGSAGWFELFHATHISAAMKNASEADVAAALLEKAWTFSFEKVVQLIKRYWEHDTQFDSQLWSVLQGCPEWSDPVTQIGKLVIFRSNAAPFALDYLLSTLGLEQPRIALELAAIRIGKQLDEAIDKTKSVVTEKLINEVLEQSNGWDTLDSLAKAEPKFFLRQMWPLFQKGLSSLRELEGERDRPGFPLPYSLDFRFIDEHSLGLSEPPILGALAVAIAEFSGKEETEFLDWLKQHEQENANPAQRLFVHALASQPRAFSNRALEFLIADKNRFHVGSIEDTSGTTKRLVQTVSPFWTDAQVNKFFQEVLAYKPSVPSNLDAERRRTFQEVIRRTKLGILASLRVEELPDDLKRYLDEERRRFPEDRIGATFHAPTWIGSPISAQSLALADDDDVVNAFQELPDISEWDHPRRWMRGGNIQLSREFANFAKANPERAFQIIRRFDPDFGTRAAGYALEAVAETADTSAVLELILLLNERGFKGDEFRGNISTAINSLDQRKATIDDSIISLLERWLSEDGKKATSDQSDAESYEETPDENQQETNEPNTGVLWSHGGLSIVPQGNYSILRTLTLLLLRRKEFPRLVDLYKSHLGRNDDLTVWRSLLQFLKYLPSSSELDGLIEIIFKRYPDLASTHEAIVMFAELHDRLSESAREIILKWKSSGIALLEQAYGELIALIALRQPELSWPPPLLSEILEEENLGRARVGAAYTAVNLWGDVKLRGAASTLLQVLIPKADKKGWSAIFDLFRLTSEISPEAEWISFLELFADHLRNAGNQESSFIVERLQTLLPHHASLVARIAQGLVANLRSDLGDIRTSAAMTARELVDLAITLHRLGPDTREAGINLFEDLLLVSAYAARETLEEIDNRFKNSVGQSRGRLPRRVRRKRQRAAVA